MVGRPQLLLTRFPLHVLRRYDARIGSSKTGGSWLEPELGARVRFQGRVGTVTHKQLTPPAGHQGDRPVPGARRFIVVFFDPGPDGRGEEIELFESDWAEIEPVDE